MKALILFLFFFTFTVIYQNCAENPDDFQNAGSNVTCAPEGLCLKYSIRIGASQDQKTSSVSIDTKPNDNGNASAPSFSQGCSVVSEASAYCNLNSSHQISFSVALKDSKVGAEQTTTIKFTPNGKEQLIDY